jgi:hypothetical protein
VGGLRFGSRRRLSVRRLRRASGFRRYEANLALSAATLRRARSFLVSRPAHMRQHFWCRREPPTPDHGTACARHVDELLAGSERDAAVTASFVARAMESNDA